MKTLKFSPFTMLVLIMFMACSDNDGVKDNVETPPINFNFADCGDMYGFVKLYSLLNKNAVTGGEVDNLFVVKGVVAGELVNNQGIKIKIMEDLKGNFKDISSILLWGNGGGDGEQPFNEFGPSLAHYALNDTLVLMFARNIWEKENGTSEIYYATSGCGYSILKFSKGNVTGRIFTTNSYEDETISMEELQSQLFNQR
ncbi:MAG: hypothetical protein LBG15_01550 [Dysgonamonadaceae bacterium]|jgi:hypothetical protein|nr:hypothetical protein [Dysgonamonadaceae bacterium]